MPQPLEGMPNLARIIEKSLKRSIEYGIDPNIEGAPETSRLSDKQLKSRIQEEYDFFSVARDELDSLYQLLKNTGFCSALADKEGYVLYIVGDPELIEHFEKRHCSPGYRWTERDMGTCAIGLTLEERIPVFLPGEKMYAARAQWISNAGAPIFSPSGEELLGVICLSGYSEKMHVHTLGLVRQSADRITAVLREKEYLHELEIQYGYMKVLLESSSRGILTVDPGGHIVQTNAKARSLLKIPRHAEGKNLAEYVDEDLTVYDSLQEARGRRPREIHIKKDGTSHYAMLDPIRRENGELVGGLISVTEKDELMQMAVAMTGTQAHFTFDSIIGSSESFQAALHLARISADSTVSVLLTGETGVGKELFAQAIHNESDRHNNSFVAINCGAIPRELFESELFGYEEGAFTGGSKGGRPGKLELANNGTLFLDEIGDMPFDMQVKLLRVLQSGELQRVGGIRSLPINMRIISATNRDLQQAIKDQQFREDLYYRICTLKITVPALRDRPEDILPLTNHFLNRQKVQLQRQVGEVSPELEKGLLAYHWPGNIRQLENAVERAVHLSEGNELLTEHFGISQASPSPDPQILRTRFSGLSLEGIEKEVILHTLNECSGNIRQAARLLEVSRPTIYRKLKKYGFNISASKPYIIPPDISGNSSAGR